MIDFGNLTDDGKLQAYAALGSTLITLIAALGAAWWGANSGVESTREAAMLAHTNALEADRIERHNERLAALLGLAFELSTNVDIADDHRRMWFSAPMLTGALHEASAHLATLPEETAVVLRRVRVEIQKYNTLAMALQSGNGSDAGRIQNEADAAAKDVREAALTASAALATYLDSTTGEVT